MVEYAVVPLDNFNNRFIFEIRIIRYRISIIKIFICEYLIDKRFNFRVTKSEQSKIDGLGVRPHLRKQQACVPRMCTVTPK